jgi:heme/copper-type cytochrome/quinol oxidase subunit 1
MPRLTRYAIKSSLIYLAVALLLGVAVEAQAAFGLPPGLNTLRPVYFHLFMVGWVTQLIFGVIYWMFPKASQERPHGSEGLNWATFGLLNVGLILRVVSEPLGALRPEAIWGWLLALSALLQWLAGVIFALNAWPRIKAR